MRKRGARTCITYLSNAHWCRQIPDNISLDRKAVRKWPINFTNKAMSSKLRSFDFKGEAGWKEKRRLFLPDDSGEKCPSASIGDDVYDAPTNSTS